MIDEFKSTATLLGKVRIEKISPDGSVEVREHTNTIMNTGKAQVAGLILADVAGTALYASALLSVAPETDSETVTVVPFVVAGTVLSVAAVVPSVASETDL
jgi:hypothetical protein